MLLREFLEEDITNYLDALASSIKKGDTAEAFETESSLEQSAKVKQDSSIQNPVAPVPINPNSVAPVISSVPSEINISVNVDGNKSETKTFIPAKDFQARAPKIVTAISRDGAKSSSSNSSSDKSLEPSNDVDDSSSLRKVIREELSDLKHDSSKKDFPSSSPSQLRRAIKEELKSIIKSGGIAGLAQEDTLRSIIHDELGKTGGLNKKNKYTPENIHIDESLLDMNAQADDLRVLEIMEKDPALRTRREELSVLAKLEDYLVDLKIAMREGSQKDAVYKYRRLKKEAITLRFFVQEKRFLLTELQLIAKALFFSIRAKQGVKKVILRESTGEITDPQDFTHLPLQKHRPVYHVALDKQGRTSFVKPSKRPVMVSHDLFSNSLKTKEQNGRLVSHKGPVSYATKSKTKILANSPSGKTFYLIQKQGVNGAKLVYHKELTKRKDLHLFSQQTSLTQKDLKDIEKDMEKRFVDSKSSKKENSFSPWEDKKQQMHNPIHTKNYLRAVRALRQKDKSTAVNMLSELHEKYPKNIAIKVRLHDALEL